jgi:single-stranded DNA-binding protein
MNDFHVTGNLVKDPEKSTTTGGTSLLKGVIADNQFYKGEKKVSYWDFVMFGKMADFMSEHLIKGSPVYLKGELEQQRWDYEGKHYSKVVLNVKVSMPGKAPLESHYHSESKAPMGLADIPF